MREVKLGDGNRLVELTDEEYMTLITALEGPHRLMEVIGKRLASLKGEREGAYVRAAGAAEAGNMKEYDAYIHSASCIIGPLIDQLQEILRLAAE